MGQIVTRRLLALLPPVSWLVVPLGLLACLALVGREDASRPHAGPDRSPRQAVVREGLLPWGIAAWLLASVPLGFVFGWLGRRDQRRAPPSDESSPERTQVENERRREHEFVESLIRAAPAIVLVLDPEGRILRCNPCLERLTGYGTDELQGRDWFTTFLPSAERSQAREGYAKLMDNQSTETVGAGSTTIITKDGQPRQVEWNHQVLHDDQGHPLGILAVGQDVTALCEARTRAVQAERLAAIGEMVTGLAHESGNALQRIQACLEMLALQVQDRPAALDLVYRIQIAQDHLHQLYEEVRQYAAPIVLRRAPAHVSDLLQQAWEHLEPVRAGRVVEFLDQVHTNYVCRVDRYAMERVFRNILENALAAAADPVRIEVLWRDAALGEQPAVEIRLRDNGPGLNPEQKKRIFEPFYTTKTQSTGLGMAITKRLVEAHGGRIAVGDPVAGGAEIVVILPKE